MIRPTSVQRQKPMTSSFINSRTSLQVNCNQLLDQTQLRKEKQRTRLRSKSGHIFSSKQRMVLTRSSYLFKTPLIDELRFISETDLPIVRRKNQIMYTSQVKPGFKTPKQSIMKVVDQVIKPNKQQIHNIKIIDRKAEEQNYKRSIVNKDFDMECHPMLLKRIMFKLRRHEG